MTISETLEELDRLAGQLVHSKNNVFEKMAATIREVQRRSDETLRTTHVLLARETEAKQAAESAAKELRDVLRHIDKAKADSPERLVEKIKTLAYRAITPAPTPESDEPADTLPADSRFVETSKWLPIESAPKDGTIIIVSGGIAHWIGEGWHSLTGIEWPGRPIQWEVTVWQPLPAAMSAPSAKGGES